MAVLYVAIGLYIITSDKILADFPLQYKIIFGIALVIYGGFRLYRYHISDRVPKDLKIDNDDEN